MKPQPEPEACAAMTLRGAHGQPSRLACLATALPWHAPFSRQIVTYDAVVLSPTTHPHPTLYRACALTVPTTARCASKASTATTMRRLVLVLLLEAEVEVDVQIVLVAVSVPRVVGRAALGPARRDLAAELAGARVLVA